MSLLFFDIFLLLMIYVDATVYKRSITPFSVMAWVYLALINVNDLIATNLFGFFPVSGSAKAVLLLCFAVIFAVDLAFGFLCRRVKPRELPSAVKPDYYWLVAGLFSVGAASYLLSFARLFLTYGLSIKGMNNGILGHLSSLGFILAPLFLDMTFKRGKKLFNLIALMMVAGVIMISVLFGGKYVIFINLIYFVLYFMLKGEKDLPWKKILKYGSILGVFAVGVFFVIYGIVPTVTGAYGENANFLTNTVFAIEHFFEYLLGPVVGNNYTISHVGEGSAVVPFVVLINIVKALFGMGNYESPILGKVFPVREDGLLTNVSGLPGELVYALGIFGALLYLAVLFAVINFLYFQYKTYRRYYMSYCYLMAMTAFSFFCNFYTVSGMVIPWLMLFAFETLLQFKRDRKRRDDA